VKSEILVYNEQLSFDYDDDGCDNSVKFSGCLNDSSAQHKLSIR